jgi:hypothetical protein
VQRQLHSPLVLLRYVLRLVLFGVGLKKQNFVQKLDPVVRPVVRSFELSPIAVRHLKLLLLLLLQMQLLQVLKR